MNRLLYMITGVSLLAAVACDDGKIYEEEKVISSDGMVAKLTGHITGINQWPEGYSLVLAGFKDGSDYAVTAKNISSSVDADGNVSCVLSGISEEVNTLELCVIDITRRRVVSLQTMDREATGDTLRMNAGNVDATPFGTIQSLIFTPTCANCHGASNTAAAGLYLTSGKSHESLVGQESAMLPGYKRVEPGNSAASVLYRVVSSDVSSQWPFDHTALILSNTTEGQNKLKLIKLWIDNGAE